MNIIKKHGRFIHKQCGCGKTWDRFEWLKDWEQQGARVQKWDTENFQAVDCECRSSLIVPCLHGSKHCEF